MTRQQLSLDWNVLPWIKVWVLTRSCSHCDNSTFSLLHMKEWSIHVTIRCLCLRDYIISFYHVRPNLGCAQLHRVPLVPAALTQATNMTHTRKTFAYYPSDSLCHRLWQRSRCYRAPRWVPLFLPGAINVTATLAPKWLPPRNGGVTSPWQPGPALRGSSACATKPGVRVQTTSWPLSGIDPL